MSNGTISLLSSPEMDEFFAYLTAHLADNGEPGHGYFQPLSRGAPFPAEREAMFRRGIEIAPGQPGWRRMWVMRSPRSEIVGHVDLRAYGESHATHRCLLGLGVHRHHRQQGIGAELVTHARQWAATTPPLEWIDLQVIGSNEAAISLYRRAGFSKTGEVEDMFRIDGQCFSYISMTLRLP